MMASQKSLAYWLFAQPFVQAQIKENIKALRHWSLQGNPLVTGGFPSQRASNVENASIWWCHHVNFGKHITASHPWSLVWWFNGYILKLYYAVKELHYTLHRVSIPVESRWNGWSGLPNSANIRVPILFHWKAGNNRKIVLSCNENFCGNRVIKIWMTAKWNPVKFELQWKTMSEMPWCIVSWNVLYAYIESILAPRTQSGWPLVCHLGWKSKWSKFEKIYLTSK